MNSTSPSRRERTPQATQFILNSVKHNLFIASLDKRRLGLRLQRENQQLETKIAVISKEISAIQMRSGKRKSK